MGLLSDRPGDRFVEPDRLPTFAPEATNRWFPISHATFYEEVRRSLKDAKIKVSREQHVLASDGRRYFGVMYVKPDSHSKNLDWATPNGCELALGLRHSIDKSIAACLLYGAEVFVCSNLAFSGEIILAQKHYSRIRWELPTLVDNAIGSLSGCFEQQADEYAAFQKLHVNSQRVPYLLLQLQDRGIIPAGKVPMLFRHALHLPKEAHLTDLPEQANVEVPIWDIFNAITEYLPGTVEAAEVGRRTMELHRRCIGWCRNAGALAQLSS